MSFNFAFLQGSLPVGYIALEPSEKSPLALNMKTNSHTLYADEPETLGGNNTAPAPYDYLHAGLGSCTAITLRYFAKNKNIDIGDFNVVVSSQRDAARILIIEKALFFSNDLPQDTVDQLVSVSKKCPMHKDLSRSIEINTSVHIGQND